MEKLSHLHAKNYSGEIVHISNARFFCVKCGERMVAKNSGKKGSEPGAKKAHFAHKVKNPRCDDETTLHKKFAKKVHETIMDKIKNNQPIHYSDTHSYLGKNLIEDKKFLLSLHKSSCDEHHKEVNLLGNVDGAKIGEIIDRKQGLCPDISLWDKDGKPFVAIEIAAKKSLKEETLKSYRAKIICVLKLEVSLNDIEAAEEKLRNPVILNCSNRNCFLCSITRNEAEGRSISPMSKFTISGRIKEIYKEKGDPKKVEIENDASEQPYTVHLSDLGDKEKKHLKKDSYILTEGEIERHRFDETKVKIDDGGGYFSYNFNARKLCELNPNEKSKAEFTVGGLFSHVKFTQGNWRNAEIKTKKDDSTRHGDKNCDTGNLIVRFQNDVEVKTEEDLKEGNYLFARGVIEPFSAKGFSEGEYSSYNFLLKDFAIFEKLSEIKDELVVHCSPSV